jgi:small subunit ribosomal protein S20
MAITKSAKKAQRVSTRRRVYNVRRKRNVHSATTDLRKFIATKDSSGSAKALPALYKAIDKAVKGGTINKNTAARMKSRLTKRVSTLAK